MNLLGNWVVASLLTRSIITLFGVVLLGTQLNRVYKQEEGWILAQLKKAKTKGSGYFFTLKCSISDPIGQLKDSPEPKLDTVKLLSRKKIPSYNNVHHRKKPLWKLTSASALQIQLGVPNQWLWNGKLIVKSAHIGQVAINEAWGAHNWWWDLRRAALNWAAELAYTLNHFNS